MKIREVLSRLDRAQRSTPFKIVASIIVVAVAVAIFATYFVAVTAPAGGPVPAAPDPTAQVDPALEAQRSAIEATERVVRDILSRREDPTSVGVGVTVGAAVALVIVWLGLGLTYLGLLLAVAVVAYPLSLFGPTRDLARLLTGIIILTASFTALMQGLRVVLGGPGPVMAIARNVLAEAVRMRISLVFIVLLIFGLAALPDLLNDDSPLRYRVQSFLQYGTGGAFWIIAILVLFFAVASVAFEQRDRQIWQTMTKPVSAWQYIFGKWLGVSALAAVLLAVCCSAIFLFTEHLRRQPAVGEVAAAAAGEQVLTDDRRILETQVLAARVALEAAPPEVIEEVFRDAVAARIEAERRLDDRFVATDEVRAQIEEEIYKNIMQSYRSIEPGQSEVYAFEGLGRVRDAGRTLTLRYRIDSGSNRPDVLYRLSFIVGGSLLPIQEASLGHSHTLPTLLPSAIDADGVLAVEVVNGDITRGTVNPATITFPPGGLEVSYSAGTYRGNFFRVALVLWIKLAFLAMIGVTAATFLSFPVACLVAFGVFFAAESAGFLSESLPYYATLDDDGNIQWVKVVIAAVAHAVAWMFRTYADLRPTTSLVDGRLLAWSSVAKGTLILTVWSGMLYVLGVAVFRRRELATYSGQ